MSDRYYKLCKIMIILTTILFLALLIPLKGIRAVDKNSISPAEAGREYIEADNKQYYKAKSVSDAGEYVRLQILDHKDLICLTCPSEAGKESEELWGMIESAAYHEDGSVTEYMNLLLSGMDISISYDDGGTCFFDCQPYYYMTANQEEKLEQEISGLSLAGDNDYETARNIYRYVCQRVYYDNDYSSLSFSAYGAQVDEKAVCQGFAMLYYLIGKNAGLDVGIVCGTATDETTDGWISHAWNVVKLDQRYYYLDPTWDSQEESYSYFLKGSDVFRADHKAEFPKGLKVSSASYGIPLKDRKIFDSSYKTLVTSVKLSGTGISHKIAAGRSIRLEATVKPAGAYNKTLVWSSSDGKVAAVNQSGKVNIRKNAGGKTVVITAKAKDGSGKKASWKIRVMKGAVKKIAIKGKNKVKAGKTLKLKAKVTAGKGANKKVQWISGNKKYAQVTASGKVKTFKAGKGKKVKITVMATDGSGKKKSKVIKIK